MLQVTPPDFDDDYRGRLRKLFEWRRDVRRFRRDPVPLALPNELLDTASLTPSVGNSQPWRFVGVETPERRAAVRAEFLRCNADALGGYQGERARLYTTLKLAGLDEAPVHLAVFVDGATPSGHGLGRGTMPETARYSVVTVVHTLWLAARARGVGVGWVSILDPETVSSRMHSIRRPIGRWWPISASGIRKKSTSTPNCNDMAGRGPIHRARDVLER